jgi:hypothetical protein
MASARRDLALPQRLRGHGFPLVRLPRGIKAARERAWNVADPPFDGWDAAAVTAPRWVGYLSPTDCNGNAKRRGIRTGS